MTDEITLTLPREPEFHRVAHLVLGGLAVRLNLTIENLEDLELALDAILVRTDPNAGEITVRMTPRDGELETIVVPLTTKSSTRSSMKETRERSAFAASSSLRSTTSTSTVRGSG